VRISLQISLPFPLLLRFFVVKLHETRNEDTKKKRTYETNNYSG
jgi:hypothetical protein